MRRAASSGVLLTAMWVQLASSAEVPPARAGRHPSLDVVRSMVEREFQGVFAVGGSAPGKEITPPFATGDFNGDGRRDVAVLVTVRPDVLERRLAGDPRWTIPGLVVTKAVGAGMPARTTREAQLTLAVLAETFQRSIVLLIVHDFDQPASPAARFALLDFCNNGTMNMTVFRKPLKPVAAGDAPIVSPPRLKGDALGFLDRRGEGTAVYWDGARYAWYPVE